MTILKTDKITFSVSFRHNGELVQIKDLTLKQALDLFNTLSCTCFLDFQASSQDSSLKASLFKKDKTGLVSVIHKHYLSQIESLCA